MSHSHVVLPGNTRPAKKKATRLRDADPHAHVEVTIDLHGPSLPTADQLPARSLTPAEFAAKYSTSQEDADKVASVLKGYGLKIEKISLDTQSMQVSGTVAQMEAAFKPNLGIYHSATQGDFRGRQGELSIPSELNGLITGVLGLDERRVARRRLAAPARPKAKPRTAAAPLTPEDLESHYSFPPGEAAGQRIAIAEFGGGYFPNDVTAFCKKYGRTAPTVSAIKVNLAPFTPAQIAKLPPNERQEQLDESGEVMMDIEIIASLCSGAALSVYFATFDQKGWVDLLNRVIHDRPVALSVSWGSAEDSGDWTPAALDAINQRLSAAATLGITVCVASGDDGSGDEQTDGKAHVDFPSTSPFVLAVGGTMLAGGAEQAWWQAPGVRPSGGATGGGVSTTFPRPKWQNVSIRSMNAGSIDGRVVPDVAALAGPPFYDLILDGDDAPNGGTSASAPVWAALIARINAMLPAGKQQQFLTPLLYQNGPHGKPRGAAGCQDITEGGNTSTPSPGFGYEAQAGFDAVTGWGTPDGKALLGELEGNAPKSQH